MRLPINNLYVTNPLPEGVKVDTNVDLSGYNKFWISKRGDVITQSEKTVNGKRLRTTYRLHRIVMGVTDPKEEVDHINRNKLDNRATNLRVCKHRDNSKNLSLKRNNTTGFSGVMKDIRRGGFVTRIKINYRNICIGSYQTIEEAISARLTAEDHYYGEFAPNA